MFVTLISSFRRVRNEIMIQFWSEAAAGTDQEQACCFPSLLCVERTQTEVEKKGQKVNATV